MKIKTVAKKNKFNERGQSLVELAISFPVILLLLIGTLDYGMATYSYLILRDAAEESAKYGSINPTNPLEIENRARYISPIDSEGIYFAPIDLRNKETVKISITNSGENCQGITRGKANSVTVNIKYDYPLIIPMAEIFTGSNIITLDASATNVIIQPACNK